MIFVIFLWVLFIIKVTIVIVRYIKNKRYEKYLNSIEQDEVEVLGSSSDNDSTQLELIDDGTNFSINRLNHSLAVARKMMEFVSSRKKKYECSGKDAFVLGFLHDIGYEFCVSPEDHNKIGGLLLKKQDYKFWKEVYYHGVVQDEYGSDLLDLLNFADLTTDSTGEDVSIEERIEDLARCYGSSSYQVNQAKRLAKKVSAVFGLDYTEETD